MSVQYHPINFDAIQKGDVFTPEQLEAITGKTAGTRNYELAVLGLAKRIMRECETRNNPVTLASVKGALRVLTDDEATIYNPQQRRIGYHKMLRAHRRLTQVDVRNLSEAQKPTLEREICVGAAMIAGARSARRKLLLNGHKRATPAALPAN